MAPDSDLPRRRRVLPRLDALSYQGSAVVHWTFGLEMRATGWLNPGFHGRFREVLTHAAIRHRCVVPIYCLMPDHLHILFWGVCLEGDLYLAARFLRQHTASALAPARYQKQAYDHVLSEKEIERETFESTCAYIAENPVRAGLCGQAKEYGYTGAVIPGYPSLAVHEEGYWDLFWRLGAKLQS